MNYLVIFLVLKYVSSTEFDGFKERTSIAEQCINLCKELQLPSLEMTNYEQVVCQRGCRFFNIIRFKQDTNLQMIRSECYLSCNESYMSKIENEICIIGCDEMGKRQMYDNGNIYLLQVDDDASNVILSEQEIEMIDPELADPSLRGQLLIGLNIDYKIPETSIRTMPIAQKSELENARTKGDWLDCASKNSGIPRWILLSAILSAVLIALWLSFSNEKEKDDEPLVEVNLSDEKMILVDNCYKEPILVLNEEVEPPKYAVESEKV